MWLRTEKGGGFAHPRHHHILAKEHSNQLGYDDDSTTMGGATAEHQPPF
jgi:hypothetical protein